MGGGVVMTERKSARSAFAAGPARTGDGDGLDGTARDVTEDVLEAVFNQMEEDE